MPLGFMLAGAMALAVWRPISSVARRAADADGTNELVLPALAWKVGFNLIPMANAVYISFTTYDLLTPPRKRATKKAAR